MLGACNVIVPPSTFIVPCVIRVALNSGTRRSWGSIERAGAADGAEGGVAEAGDVERAAVGDVAAGEIADGFQGRAAGDGEVSRAAAAALQAERATGDGYRAEIVEGHRDARRPRPGDRESAAGFHVEDAIVSPSMVGDPLMVSAPNRASVAPVDRRKFPPLPLVKLPCTVRSLPAPEVLPPSNAALEKLSEETVMFSDSERRLVPTPRPLTVTS